jgi:hypothetical protein
LILLAGLPGSGKTLAASLLAQSQGTPLYYLDLKELDTDHQVHVLPALLRLEAPVMLIQSAHLWFGRQTALPAAALHHWIAQRRQVPGFTCLGVSFLQTMRPSWRQLVDETFIFPDSYNKSRIKK